MAYNHQVLELHMNERLSCTVRLCLRKTGAVIGLRWASSPAAPYQYRRFRLVNVSFSKLLTLDQLVLWPWSLVTSGVAGTASNFFDALVDFLSFADSESNAPSPLVYAPVCVIEAGGTVAHFQWAGCCLTRAHTPPRCVAQKH
eukprot:gb/GECG01015491.1/.p1 GENE.gb/GECG01015491.1/~~gb/GECG01015491.1/.p1  ORF type:complete len:143 (+),score=2.20 gb/GECG01015491.1/:1-429(+)